MNTCKTNLEYWLSKALDPDEYNQSHPIHWAWAYGYEGVYAVSELGDIYSMKLGRALKPRITGTNKYKKVDLYKDGKRKTQSVHKVVWQAFHGEIPEGHNIDHVNNNREDNRLCNLRLMTFEDHMLKHSNFYVKALCSTYPYEKEFTNLYEIKQAGLNINKIKQAMKSGTKYNGFYWFGNRGH